ncbi:lipopolysaccharide biosynthesis protein [Vibrio sp. YIC-376]|uniref:lipopolysaccharide biosynthesis protein n=1 Tax=Vibrio sp. YIC-376 TaxID=3136162 RepID=UPI00402A64E7
MRINLPTLSGASLQFLKLLGSSGFVGIIGLMLIPVISRLYSPEELGQFQLILSLVIIFSSISSLKYEMAIALPLKRYRKNILSLVSFMAIGIYFIMLIVFISPIFRYLDDFYDVKYIYDNRYFVLSIVLVMGIVQSLNMNLITNGHFDVIIKNKFILTLISNGINIVGGIYNPTYYILIISHLISYVVVLANSTVRVKIRNIFTRRNLNLSYYYARLYKKFPTINTIQVVINTFSIHMPVFVLTKHYGAEVVGIYMLANRILEMPYSLIINSMTQVYIKYSSESLSEDKNKLKSYYKSTVGKLTAIALMLLCAIVLFYAFFVDLIFNENWYGIGQYMLLICISKTFQLLNAPVASTLNLINKQEMGLIIVLFFVLLRFVSINLGENPFDSLLYYCLSTAIFYIVYNLSIYRELNKI